MFYNISWLLPEEKELKEEQLNWLKILDLSVIGSFNDNQNRKGLTRG